MTDENEVKDQPKCARVGCGNQARPNFHYCQEHASECPVCKRPPYAHAPECAAVKKETMTDEQFAANDELYGWDRCNHEGIGKPGCRTCDPQKLRVYDRYEFLLKRSEMLLNMTITDLARRHAWAMALYSAFKKIEKEVLARIAHDHALLTKDALSFRVAEVIQKLSKKELEKPVYIDRKLVPPCPECNGTGDIGADAEIHCMHCGGDGKLDVERFALMQQREARLR